ncbi:MAG TPA: adenosine deaminase [Anaerolineae bacterium]|nr:adenosine deaminase [Anaerolineae bacterium]HIQ06528.1 adenosine deaminase [Anaerolineae bacterium]
MDIATLPKTHLHLHLEGAIRPTTILDLYHRQGGVFADLTLDQVVARAQMTPADTSFLDFVKKFEFIMPCLREPDDLVRITREIITDADADGVKYVELRFCPHFIEALAGIPVLASIEAVIEGVRQGMADHPDVASTLTLIIDQTRGNAAGEEAVRWAARYREQGVSGVDIAGDPNVYPLTEYEPACKLARDLGIGITVHAGETQGPQTVRIAVERLHATRIGHGIRAAEDPAVLDLLLAREITLEVSVSSNVYTRSVPSLEAHPLPRLLAAGVRVTFNTDDPGIFNLTLSEEYALLQRTFGLTLADFHRANLHAVDAAFVGEGHKAALRAAIEAGYAAVEV